MVILLGLLCTCCQISLLNFIHLSKTKVDKRNHFTYGLILLDYVWLGDNLLSSPSERIFLSNPLIFLSHLYLSEDLEFDLWEWELDVLFAGFGFTVRRLSPVVDQFLRSSSGSASGKRRLSQRRLRRLLSPGDDVFMESFSPAPLDLRFSSSLSDCLSLRSSVD